MSIANRQRFGQRFVLGICVLAASVGLGIGGASAQQVAVQTDQPEYRPADSRPQRSVSRPNAVAAVSPTAGTPASVASMRATARACNERTSQNAADGRTLPPAGASEEISDTPCAISAERLHQTCRPIHQSLNFGHQTFRTGRAGKEPPIDRINLGTLTKRRGLSRFFRCPVRKNGTVPFSETVLLEFLREGLPVMPISGAHRPGALPR